MRDLGQALLSKTDTIVSNRVEAVRQDGQIHGTEGLTYQSVRDSITIILEAIATLLTHPLADQPQTIEDKSLKHGLLRAEQGYNIAEIVREYGLLRKIIFSALEPDLLASSVSLALQAVEAINTGIDKVTAICLESYLGEKLQELSQVQSQMILTNQELTRLVIAQKDDLSYLAHELKNPLNVMMGFSKLLLQQQQKLAQGQGASLNLEMIERVLNNGQQLLRLINNALEISRCEAGQIELNLESIPVQPLIQSVTEALKMSACRKNLEVVVNCTDAPQQVMTDSLRLQQIVTNLVSNALRYTESGTIRVICQSYGDRQWSFAVSDTGSGIAPDVQAQIFQPYFRVGSEGNYSPQSTGLGLAIVAKLVKLLQGEIELVSEVGEGSTFYGDFPLNS